MANTPVEFKATPAISLTLSLYRFGSDTAAASVVATEATNRKGLYTAVVVAALTGWHTAKAADPNGLVWALYDVLMTDDTDIHRCVDTTLAEIDLGAVATAAALAGVQTDVDELQARLPADPADQSAVEAAVTAAQAALSALIGALNNLSQAQAQAASTAALASYDPPTQAEMDARTLPAASYATSTAQTTAQSSLTAIQTAIASLVASVWAGITTAAMNRVADVVLRRKMANVKASADGDAMAAADSLYGMTQQHRRASTAKNPGFLTVFDPDGVELEQIDLGTSVASRPVVEMGDIP